MAMPSSGRRWRPSSPPPTISRATSIPGRGLYRTFHAIWSSANVETPLADSTEDSNDREAIAQARLARVTPLSRQALLLTAMEGFTSDDAGYLISASAADVDSLVAEA